MTTTPDIRDIASVTKQEFPVTLFNFGKAQVKLTDFFNCGVCRCADGLWLVTRRAKWDKTEEFSYNDVWAFSLDRNLIPQMGYKVAMGDQFPDEHFEDPRVIIHNGRTFVSACNFVRSKRGMTYPHQVISEVDSRWQLIRRYDPVYGQNGGSAGKQVKHEKNWLWFWHDDHPNLLYNADPLTIARFNPSFTLAVDGKQEWESGVWTYGHIRGGTPPMLVDGEYYTFFHSSTDFNGVKRQYHMGCLAFEGKPPFRITRITMDPLLSGSRHDGGLPDKPPCVFPCGAILEGDRWLVTMGINDLRCGWCYIPHATLKDRMIEIK